jgi:hypothetical protein
MSGPFNFHDNKLEVFEFSMKVTNVDGKINMILYKLKWDLILNLSRSPEQIQN